MQLTSRLSRKAFFVLSLLWAMTAFVLIMQYQMGGEGDKNGLLSYARKLLEGKQLYVDMSDTNPPLIIWLYQLPALLAKLTGLEDYHALIILVTLLIAVVLYLCHRLLTYHAGFSGDNARFLPLHTLVLAFVTIFWVNSIYFGDREHLFVICILPYLLRCMPGLSRVSLSMYLRIIIGLLAALGFCIKPHCLIIFIAVQLFTVWCERRIAVLFTLENWMIGCGWVCYLGAVYYFVPIYFTTIFPMALATYSAYTNTAAMVLFYFPPLLSFSVAFAEFRPRHTTPYRADIFYLSMLCFAGFLYVLANNGWLYTFYPFNSFVMLAVGWLGVEFFWLKKQALKEGNGTQSFSRGLVACVIVITLNIMSTCLPYVIMFTATSSPVSNSGRIMKAFRDVIAQNHVASFGAIPISAPIWPRLERVSHVAFSTRFANLWMMPKFVVSGEEFRRNHEWIAAYLANAFADDLNRRKPELMFVDVSPHFGNTGKPFDMLHFLGEYSDFAQAWKAYHFLQRVDVCDEIDGVWQQKLSSACSYDVYKRK